jgi:hypothetical protein
MKKLLVTMFFVSTLMGMLVLPGIEVAQAADAWSWKAQFDRIAKDGSKTSIILNGGPFTAQSACYADVSSAIDKYQQANGVTLNGPTQNFCVCDKTVASQGAECPGYTPNNGEQGGQNPSPGGGDTGTQSPTGSQTVGDGNAFVPVSDIPAFGKAGAAPSLPTFLNTLYTYCIGIAVVIAVLQLARAGITYTLADSLTSKEEARHLIGASVFGLILVLSPYIVFKIINPQILTLNIDVSGLQLNNIAGGAGGTQNGEGQGGLTQGQEDNGAKPLYDTGYFDLLEFDGTDDQAYAVASGYTCQTQGQTKSQFNQGGHAPYFVSCVTHAITYQMLAGGGFLNQTDQANEDRFERECNGLGDAQVSKGFNDYDPNKGLSNTQVDCGQGQKCFNAWTSCDEKKQ